MMETLSPTQEPATRILDWLIPCLYVLKLLSETLVRVLIPVSQKGAVKLKEVEKTVQDHRAEK